MRALQSLTLEAMIEMWRRDRWTKSSDSRSSRLEAFDELGYPPLLNAMECGFQIVGMSRRLEVHDLAGVPYRSRAL